MYGLALSCFRLDLKHSACIGADQNVLDKLFKVTIFY